MLQQSNNHNRRGFRPQCPAAEGCDLPAMRARQFNLFISPSALRPYQGDDLGLCGTAKPFVATSNEVPERSANIRRAGSIKDFRSGDITSEFRVSGAAISGTIARPVCLASFSSAIFCQERSLVRIVTISEPHVRTFGIPGARSVFDA